MATIETTYTFILNEEEIAILKKVLGRQTGDIDTDAEKQIITEIFDAIPYGDDL